MAETKKYVHFSDKMTESLMNINKVIQENKSTLDSVQDMAVELTRAIRSLETVAVRYIKIIDSILDAALPVMKTVPIFGEKVLNFVTEAQALSDKLMATCQLAETVLPNVEAGLSSADMTQLKSSTGDVQKLTKSFQLLIPAATKK